jgi:mono/diheme cytochrome c family protein
MQRLVLFTAAALVAFLNFGTVQAQAADDVSEAYTISRGAQLYDKWWVPTKAPTPDATHPAYPATSKKSGKNTWRCKECHGWDYIGADGRYSKGSHFSGIKGVSGAAGTDPADIAALLRGDLHGYTTDMIPDAAMAELALFVSRGQVDPRPYMAADGSSNGDVAAGKVYYEGVCAGCHGLDGRKIKDADSLGAVSGNTQEMMHKVLNGQPGEAMPALRVLDAQVAADIVAYVQTLPE